MFTFNQGTYDLHLTRGDTLTLDFQFDEETTLTEEDSLYFTVKKTASACDATIEKKMSLLENGVARVVFSSEDTAGLAFGKYLWDLRIFYANGQVTSPIAPAGFYVDAVVGRSIPSADILPDDTRYTGDYSVTPNFVGITLPTRGKWMSSDLTINPIEVSITENLAGGNTVYIGG